MMDAEDQEDTRDHEKGDSKNLFGARIHVFVRGRRIGRENNVVA